MLAAKARPDPRKHRGRPATVWTLLSAVAPELSEWAAFFALRGRRNEPPPRPASSGW
ncbi:SAV_6107 family HEPN domain-containing protein [Fodinicola feengrottensis]|uniref:SAV_6107 family HEPN domain-containing protein n=1 Tax=Fodinicola feengrottensis TaxID=435914 RepID=UPI0036F1EF51